MKSRLIKRNSSEELEDTVARNPQCSSKEETLADDKLEGENADVMMWDEIYDADDDVDDDDEVYHDGDDDEVMRMK